MKTIIFSFVILVATNLLIAQDANSKIFSTFRTGLYGGINFSTLSSSGLSFIVEGKTNLSNDLNAKLSIGYSKSNVLDRYKQRWYTYYEKYQTRSWDVEKVEYTIYPISAALEYIIMNDILSPYCFFEFGYNIYYNSTFISNWTQDGEYETYEQIPAEYKNQSETSGSRDSYRIGLGVGINYKVLESISLDIRYLYQINKRLINTNQILAGFNFSY